MRIVSARNLFVLAVFGFQAISVEHVNMVFNPSSRWALVLALALLLLLTNSWLQGLAGLFGLLLAMSWGWALLTSFWSGLPHLTILKSVALGLTAVSFMAGGRHWVRSGRSEDALAFLLPVVGLGLLAVIVARGADTASYQLGTIVVFQGLTSNPNTLGLLLVLGVPYLLWKVHSGRNQKRVLWVWVILLGLAVTGLLWTHSRAAILTGLLMIWGYAFTCGAGRKLTLAITTLLVLLITVIAAPQVIDAIEKRYVFKGADVEAGVLATRRDVWSESLDYARRGSLFGGGYGVTLGDEGFAGGWSAVGYGREKGNSQLAIWEETGLVGLTLYGLQIVCLLWVLKRGIQGAPNRDIKVLMGIVAGSLVGLVAHSVFEAWWTSPGSPEAVAFWSLAGVYTGLIAKRSRPRVRQPQPSLPGRFALRERMLVAES